MRIALLSLMFCSSVFSLLHCKSAFASQEVCHDSLGVLHCDAGEIDAIDHIGNVILSGTHVTDRLTVIGDLDASNAEIAKASITGNVDLSHAVLHQHFSANGIFHMDNTQFDDAVKCVGNVKSGHDIFSGTVEMIGDVQLDSETFKSVGTFTGRFSAENTTFSAPIMLNACVAELSQSSTKDIQLSPQKNCPDAVEKLYLKNKTEVAGNISFVGGNGQVYLSQDSVIRGQVNGGTVIHQ